MKDNPEVTMADFALQDLMTLRDWFAGQALRVIISRTGLGTPMGDLRADQCAQAAFQYADAMMAARQSADMVSPEILKRAREIGIAVHRELEPECYLCGAKKSEPMHVGPNAAHNFTPRHEFVARCKVCLDRRDAVHHDIKASLENPMNRYCGFELDDICFVCPRTETDDIHTKE